MGTRNASIRGAENGALQTQIRLTQEAIDERDTLVVCRSEKSRPGAI